MNIALFVGLLFGLLNIVVTVGVLRSKSYKRQQKIFQLFIIWLIPVLGPIVCWRVLREDHRFHKAPKSGGNEFLESTYASGYSEHSGHGGGTDGSH